MSGFFVGAFQLTLTNIVVRNSNNLPNIDVLHLVSDGIFGLNY